MMSQIHRDVMSTVHSEYLPHRCFPDDVRQPGPAASQGKVLLRSHGTAKINVGKNVRQLPVGVVKFAPSE